MADSSGSDAIIAAGISTVGNAAVAAASNKRQYKNQIAAMEKQQQQNKDLWDYQNAYNTPAQQMARLKAAGLNPNLIYGSGTGGPAGPIPSAEVPTKQVIRPNIDASGAFSAHLNARQADAQYAATLQNMDLMKTTGNLKEAQIAMQNLKLYEQANKNKYAPVMAKAAADTAQFVALRSGELFANERTKGKLMDQLTVLRDKQMSSVDLDNVFKTYRNNLAKEGIYSSDHPAFRFAIQAAAKRGLSSDDVINGGWNAIKHFFGSE